jgi:hypothetical protein
VPTKAGSARGAGEYEEEKVMKRTTEALVAMMLVAVLVAGPVLAAPVLEIYEAAEILVRAHLIACGYHHTKEESGDVPEANAGAKPAGIPGALELSEKTTHRPAELRVLSEKAEACDKEARKECARWCAPPLAGGHRAGLRRRTEGGTHAGPHRGRRGSFDRGGPLRKARHHEGGDSRGGSHPSEVLLTERVASLWMLTTLLEVLIATQYRRNAGDGPERPSPSYIIQQSRMLESASRRDLAAIKEFGRARKLQG